MDAVAGPELWNDGGAGGYRRLLLLGKSPLQGVADLTCGSCLQAETNDQLLEPSLNLPSQITQQKQAVVLTAAFSAAGAAFVVMAAGLSFWWNRLPCS